MQKRSFCRAIPIVLVGKGCCFGVQNNRFRSAKLLFLCYERLFGAENGSVCAVQKHENMIQCGDFSPRTNFFVEFFKMCRKTIFA